MTKRYFILLLIILFFSFERVNAMNEEGDYIIDQIKVLVWGGFEAIEDVKEHVFELVEDEGIENAAPYLKMISEEFLKKEAEEKSWPKPTDVDKLNLVFLRLKEKGILCLHNAGYTMSDGHYDANEAISNYPKGSFYGYCFYHGQDLERAVQGHELMLAYNHVKGDVPEKINVASVLKVELEKESFSINWNGSTN